MDYVTDHVSSDESNMQQYGRLVKKRNRDSWDEQNVPGGVTQKKARADDNELLVLERLWVKHIRALEAEHPDLFSSTEAKLMLRTKLDPGECAYRGLGATISNCVGLRRVYLSYFKPRIQCGKGSAQLKQTITATSQFMRWAVAASVSHKHDVWKENTLYESVANRDLLIRFMNYIRCRCSPATVRTKAVSLRIVCSTAILYVRDESLRASLAVTTVILRNIANAAKLAHRRRCQVKKSLSGKATSVTRLSVNDYMLCVQRSQVALKFLIRNYRDCGWENKSESNEISKQLDKVLFLENWCRSFTGFLMLVSGGQRPQVFAQVQVPHNHELQRMMEARTAYIELRTLNEKRPRDTDLPHLVLPSSVLPFLKFHIDFVRPMIREVTAKPHNTVWPNFLLLDTNTGFGLKPASVTRILQSFLAFQDPKLACMTSMDLRSDYASIMTELYRRRRVFAELSETQFLRKLAKQMNTSTEQLRRTYIVGDKFCVRSVQQLMNFWTKSVLG